ncbi:MAG: ABC transporter ATP-binding protein [Rhizobiaceae bacterium]|nr:ABC transporter ATP-binding protein [Rhizobiaceae bacterium]
MNASEFPTPPLPTPPLPTNDASIRQALVAVQGVSLSFGGNTVLSNVDLNVRSGEIYSIIGPNGAGKTSLLNCINGFYKPTAGRISFDDKDMSRLSVSRLARMGVARTFQNLALFRDLSTIDNLLLGRNLMMKTSFAQAAWYWGATRNEELNHRAAVEETVHLLQLAGVRDATVGRLSYGTQKRIEFGRALASRPKLILLDEPMAGMTQVEKSEMSAFIRTANKLLDVTVILIEHDVGIIMDLSDRIAVLDRGVKIAEGSPRQISTDESVIAAYLGTDH